MYNIYELSNGFRGVWIQRKLFEIPDLSNTERMILAIIDGLDNESRCYASNRYIAKIMNLSPGRISAIINSLKDRDYVSSSINKYEGNRRYLKCNIPLEMDSAYHYDLPF